MFAAFVVFLNSIELICSEPKTLEDLFPGYKGIIPPVELFIFQGSKRFAAFVFARDGVAATLVSTSNNPVYKQAHIRACRQANDRADIVEQEQAELLNEHQTTVEDIIIKIKEEYCQVYNRAFTLHLYHHGEYNLKGHREKHCSKKL